MNKNKINDQISLAYDAIKEAGIVEADGMTVKKAFRGQISTFGAAVTMGSMEAAIAFFSDKGSAAVDREKLIKAIALVLKKDADCAFEPAPGSEIKSLFDYAVAEKEEAKESILNAAIAIKLAMNLFKLE